MNFMHHLKKLIIQNQFDEERNYTLAVKPKLFVLFLLLCPNDYGKCIYGIHIGFNDVHCPWELSILQSRRIFNCY